MKTAHKTALVVALVALPTLLHYTTAPTAGPWHDIYQRFYYLPVILAGLWFGARGGLGTALCIAIVYFPHVYHGWAGPHSLFFRLMEIGMYHVVGALTGYLSSSVRAAMEAEKRSRLEQETAYARLKEKTAELFNLEEQLRRSDRLAALGRLSAGLAHEVRNPLGSIKAAVELLRDHQAKAAALSAPHPAPADSAELLAVLLEETERLDRTLTEFLDFAKTEEAAPGAEAAFCRLGDALARTLELAKFQLEKKQLAVEYDRDALDLPVFIHESRLRQVFLNLILNSIDALPAGGAIRIHGVARSPRAVAFLFEDTGPGIPEEIADRVFDPFFTTKEGGTGLGLSIVERIVTSHSGRIELLRDARPLCCFRITLPLRPPGYQDS